MKRHPSNTSKHSVHASAQPAGSQRRRRLATRLAIALMLCLPACGIATARYDAWADQGYSLAIQGVEDVAEISAYRIISVNYDEKTLVSEDPMYTWGPETQDWVRTRFPSYIDGDGNVTNGFDATLSDTGELEGNRPEGDAAIFYDALAAAVSKGEIELDAAGKRTGDGTIDNLAPGGYLVLARGGLKVYRPSAASLAPAWSEDDQSWNMPESAAIMVKASEVPVSKSVNGAPSATGRIGSILDFEINASIPAYPDEALEKAYSISDTLPPGLAMRPETLETFGVAGDRETPLSEGVHYSFVEDDEKDKAFRIDFDYDAISRFDRITLRYEAMVSESVSIGSGGNINTVSVIYSNDPYAAGSFEEQTTDASVFSYGIEILKTGDDQQPVGGADFVVSRSADASDPLSFIQVSPGRYRLASGSEQGDSTVSVAGDGTLQIAGLECGEYYLTETKAPDGYTRPAAPFKATVTDVDGDGSVEGPSRTDGYSFLQIANARGFVLPATGGSGTIAVAGAGMTLILGAAALRVAARKRSRERHSRR